MLDTHDGEIRSLRHPSSVLAGLMGLPIISEERPPQSEAEIIKEAWEARRAHPVYRSLRKNPNFLAAWRAFSLAVKKSKKSDPNKLNSGTAPFIFLRVFVEYAGDAYQVLPLRRGRSNMPKNEQYGATADRRRKAMRRARELKELCAQGIQLEDFLDRRTFDSLLGRLIEQLEEAPRKEYGGKRWLERKLLKNLAFSLLAGCDLRSPAVVSHFARMVNIPCDEKTAQRYCNEAARKWRGLLARASRDYTDKKSVVSG